MDLIEASFVLFLCYFLTLRVAKYFKVSQILVTSVFALRTIISLIYLPIAKALDTDAYGYFEYVDEPRSGNPLLSTNILFIFTKFLRNTLDINIYSMTFIFSFIGIIGTLAFISNIENLSKKANKNIKFLSGLIIFFPILNLWTSCIGKDGIAFSSVNLIIFAFLNLRSRLIILIIPSIVLSLLRPIVGILLFISLTISFIAKSNLPTFRKYIMSSILIIGTIAANFINASIRPLLSLNVIKLSTIISSLNFYAEETATGNLSISLTDMPFPLKIFTFMFRPLFFDANGFYTLLMSVENLILILIFLYPVIKIIRTLKTNFINFNSLTIFLITYLTSNWLLYSLTIANLGTANRYKLMFLPALTCLSLIFSSKTKLLSKDLINN